MLLESEAHSRIQILELCIHDRQQRLEILFDLVRLYREEHGCSERLERVYRIVELSRS